MLPGQFKDINILSITNVFQPHTELTNPVVNSAKWTDNKNCIHFGVLVLQQCVDKGHYLELINSTSEANEHNKCAYRIISCYDHHEEFQGMTQGLVHHSIQQ
jgi:hypothetical protein